MVFQLLLELVWELILFIWRYCFLKFILVKYILFQNKTTIDSGNVSFTGIEDLFQTPPRKSMTPDSKLSLSMYADLPDSPSGPGEMFVSPLTDSSLNTTPQSKGKGRMSTALIGVKEMFASKKQANVRLSGVKRIFASPKQKSGSPKLGGVKRLMTTPKQRGKKPISAEVDLDGMLELFATPKSASKRSFTPKSVLKAAKSPVRTQKKQKVAKSPVPAVETEKDQSPTKSMKKSPVAKVVKKSSDAKVVMTSPLTKVVKKSPAAKIGKKSLVAKVGKKSPVSKVVLKSPKGRGRATRNRPTKSVSPVKVNNSSAHKNNK